MNTTERVIKIVGYLAKNQTSASPAELSKKLRLNRIGVFRTISVLEKARWVIRDADSGKYALGSAMMEIGSSLFSNMDLTNVSRPYLERLSKTTGETSVASIRVGLERVVIDQVLGTHHVLSLVSIGDRWSLWKGCTGKSILAHLSEAEIKTALEESRKSEEWVYASREPIDIGKIEEELQRVKEVGYLVTSGELLADSVGVAAPIFGRGNKVAGAISLFGPSSRFTVEQANKYGSLLKHLSQQISRQLGATS